MAAPVKVRLTVSPGRVLVDQAVRIRLTGLRPKERIQLTASTTDLQKITWRSKLAFTADSSGTVDTRGAMRLFWSMAPTGRFETQPGFTPQLQGSVISIRALAGNRVLAAGRVARDLQSRDVAVKQLTLADDGLAGTFLAKPSAAPRPAVLQLGGSLGGHSQVPAGLIASHGFPTLSLAYFGEDGLPATLKDIPLEYFAGALTWLARQPGVDPRRIAVVGVSRGGEAGLLVGATYPDLVRGVVSCTGSADVLGAFPGPGAAWTLAGRPVAAGPIPVEKLGGPALVFGAGHDAVGPSAASVQEIVDRARAHGRRDIVGRIYPNAGHGTGCVIPNVPQRQEYQVGASTFQARGGTVESNALAAVSAWPLLLRFIADVPR